MTDVALGSVARASAVRPGKALAVAVRVLAALEKEHVRYCHWKSVWAIERSLSGESDLDLLIDRRQSRYAQEVLARCGFKRFMATEATGYSAVEDYVGLDPEAGRLVHCHVHYRLILGEPNLKSYRLPWEKLLLDTRRLDATTNIYVAESNLEMLVLLVRYATKLRYRNIVGHLLGRTDDPETINKIIAQGGFVATTAGGMGLHVVCVDQLIGDLAIGFGQRVQHTAIHG